MSNVIDMDEYRQGLTSRFMEDLEAEAEKLEAHEAWEHELAVATAHSVGHLYIDKLKGIYPQASESLLVYKVMCGVMGRACELLREGDPSAPALFGWMQFIANDVADKSGFDLNDDDLMDEAMGLMYQHRFEDSPEAE